MFKEIKRRLGLGLALIVLVSVVSCSDEATNPEPASNDYLLYYSYDIDSLTHLMPVYSTGELKAVDTLLMGTDDQPEVYHDLRFTADGMYAVAGSFSLAGPSLLVHNWPARDTAAIINTNRVHNLVLSHGESKVAGFFSGGNGLSVYQIPSLSEIWSDSAAVIFGAAFLPGDSMLLYGMGYTDTLLKVRLSGSPGVIDTLTLTSADGSQPLVRTRFTVDPERELLYVTGTVGSLQSGQYEFQVYSLDPFSLEYHNDISLGYTHRPVLSNSGRWVYLYSTLDSDQPPYYPGILSYDRTANTLQHYLDSTEVVVGRFQPVDVQLTPDDELLLVCTGRVSESNMPGPGQLVVIDRSSREILKVFTHEGGRGNFVRCYPIPREK